METASYLLGFINKKEMVKENYQLGKACEEKDDYIQILEKVISDLEHTLGLTLSGKVKRGTGRPQVRIPDNIEELVAQKAES